MNDFYKLARECHEERLQKERFDKYNNPSHLVEIKTDFIFYYHVNELPYNTEVFKQFLKENNIKLAMYDKMWLLKELFGLEFEYNHKTEKWVKKLA